VFQERWQARGGLSFEQELRLVLETLRRSKPMQPQEEVNALDAETAARGTGRQVAWTGERLKRDVLARTLPGRDLVLIDGPPALARCSTRWITARDPRPLLAARRPASTR